jgi:hypothetical protein
MNLPDFEKIVMRFMILTLRYMWINLMNSKRTGIVTMDTFSAQTEDAIMRFHDEIKDLGK